jgi:hypothetical protein
MDHQAAQVTSALEPAEWRNLWTLLAVGMDGHAAKHSCPIRAYSKQDPGDGMHEDPDRNAVAAKRPGFESPPPS